MSDRDIRIRTGKTRKTRTNRAPLRPVPKTDREPPFGARETETEQQGEQKLLSEFAEVRTQKNSHEVERKRAEEALRKSEERFRQFADNSSDVFWIVDAERQQLEYLNPVYEKIWGEPRERMMRDIGHWLELVHPEDRERGASAMPRVLAGESFVMEYRIVRPDDGAVRWIRDTVFPIRDPSGRIYRVAGVAQDVTKDKERSQTLAATEERFRLLVEGAKDYAMFILDPSNIITHWNSGAERIFGWSAEEAIGQSGEIVFTPEDRAREVEDKEIEIALRDGSASDRRWHVRKDGSRVWVDGVMQRLDDEKTGALRGFAKIARDATEQRKAEEALRRAHDELEQRVRERTAELQAMNDTLEDEMERRQALEREILQVTERERTRISQDLHDSLCQELTATAFLLKSRAKNLARKDSATAGVLEDAAATVNQNAGRARDLARGLHAIELGEGGLTSALRELCSRTNEKLTCRCEVPRTLRVDANIAVNLYRIAQEAVLNALKHAKANEIVICLAREGREIVLSVADDGKSKSGKLRPGLGLHLMRYRANAVGGRLEIDAKRGHGTKVTCRVPVKG
jgi:PAS domain S-box-containing protein